MKRHRSRNPWRALALTVASAAVADAAPAWAQMPLPPTGPVFAAPAPPGGPLHRMCYCLRDRFIGQPEYFQVPPPGFRVNETFGVMTGRADVHQFTLYDSDFVAGTTTLSPLGAQRLSWMANRLPKWLGPVVIEWTPDRPGLAEARRGAVLASLQGAGLPVGDERVAIAPSTFPGLPGTQALNNHHILIRRDVEAPTIYSVSPTTTADFSGGPR